MKVTIEVVREVWHAKTVEMSEEDFKRLENEYGLRGNTGRRARDEIEQLVPATPDNWQDEEVKYISKFRKE